MNSVEWDIKVASDQVPEAWLQWSRDKSMAWHGLAVGRGNEAKLDIASLRLSSHSPSCK